MALIHNYLETSGFKPTAAETTKAELVINLADGTLWSENGAGTVIQVGGAADGLVTADIGVTVQAYSAVLAGTTASFTTADETKVDFLAVTQAVDLDALETASHSHTNKAVLDLTTASFVVAQATKLANISITQPVDLDALETASHSHTNKAVLDATTASFLIADESKLDGIEAGADVNNISDVNATDLTDGLDSALHYHSADRSRANHTGTQVAATISDFDVEVANNTTVAANTAARHTHANKTILDNTTASFVTADETKLDNITVTQPVNLDDIETRVNELDSAMVLTGTWDASAGDFPDSANTTPSLGGSIQAGMSWIVNTGGTVNGVVFTADDRIIALVASASNTTYAGNWHKADYTDLVQSVKGNATAVQTGAVSLDPDDFSDGATTNKFVTAGDITKLSNLSGTNTGDQNTFGNVAVGGQSTISADGLSDTLTLAGTGGVTITTNAATDTVTIDASGIDGTTNLAFASRTTTQYQITSSSGSNATITGATSTLAGAMVAADKVKSDHITVTQAVDLDAMETKTNHITVTQAVNLDTIEANQTGSLLTGEAV